jgi:hypothetical protein
MKTTSQLALSLLLSALAGSVHAEGAQTAPGASRGPTTVNPSASGSSANNSNADPALGKDARGGVSNDTSASGMGTTQGSGGMQPRLDKGNGNGTSGRATPNGNAQGL